MSALCKIDTLKANISEKEILHGVNLSMNAGEIHVIMGPNGSGKSTLASVLMGNPRFDVTGGSISFDDDDITDLDPEERAARGLYLAFQYPREIAGVRLDNFLFTAYKNIFAARKDAGSIDAEKPMSVFKFRKKIREEADLLGMKKELLDRSINEGFSGGEKKKAEMLQLAMLEPRFAIFDETDSGLDVDALKIVAESINRYHTKDTLVLLVTHYQRILQYLEDFTVHVMINGTIVKSGGKELAAELEKDGYNSFLK